MLNIGCWKIKSLKTERLKTSCYGQWKGWKALEYSRLRAPGNPEKSRDPVGAWNWNPKKWVNSDNSSRLRPLNQKNNLQVSQTDSDKGLTMQWSDWGPIKRNQIQSIKFISWYLKFQTKSVNQSRQDDQTKCLLIYITYLCITVQIHIRACWKNWLFPMRSLEKGSTLLTP